ncbi:hypothetical protein CTI12_AA029350 [Artemisia annua]|uniref:Uncharacterized protein n=1 Tax=Artemisia annua TaxID=35608 RepID=A0A2U1QHJ2_ARTAN|nr:hypothetical protein CTI12_AA029350 [Artemisia annua]
MENNVANGDAHVSHRLAGVTNSQITIENHVANGDGSITDRLARVANSQDRGRQFYLFFERYRFILLNGQRDDRRHMGCERVLLQQLQAFRRELQGLPESVLMSRTSALVDVVIAIVEQRIHSYGRLAADTGRIARLVMDYLGDVMHIIYRYSVSRWTSAFSGCLSLVFVRLKPPDACNR